MPGSTGKGAPYSLGTDAAATIDDTMQRLAEWADGRPGVSPLSTVQRDGLVGVELWDGRIIWNTTTAQLERYSTGTAAWGGVFKEATVFPDDRNFTIQGEVRVDNAALDFYIAPYIVYVPSGVTNRIVRITHVLRSGGTAACALDRIAADGIVTRLATFTAGTTLASTATGLPVTLADRDRIALVVTGVTNLPKHLTVDVAHEQAR